MPRVKDKVLRPVHPNSGLQALYQRKIDRLVDEMARSYAHWIKAQYRAKPPVMAQDASPSVELQREIAKLGTQWERKFAIAAPRLARWFATSVARRSMRALMGILKEGGIAVDFVMTKGMRDVFAATVAENVSLIKSIASQYHTEVEGLVMRSVLAGRDLAYLNTELRHRFGVTARRAKLIAKDQNNKATAVFTRVRQQEVGIEEAVWLHSHGGNEPRPTHLANSGKRYKIAEGWFDPDPKVRRHIWPGELINCFPAETRIESALNVEVAYRHWHCGELAEIVTDSGKTLRATVNHPIMTGSGWKPIGDLDEGDDVIEVSQQGVHLIVSERDEYDSIPLIGEIFDAVSNARGSESKVALGADFHGDVADRDVDIVFAANRLSFGRQSFDQKSLAQFGLALPDQPTFGSCTFAQLSFAAANAANRVVGRLSQGAALIRGSMSHPNERCVAAVANGAAYALDPVGDSLPLMAELARKRKNTFPAVMQFAKMGRVVRVKRGWFSGHVFNLQTSSGWYNASGIIVHNCRCVPKPVVKGFS